MSTLRLFAIVSLANLMWMAGCSEPKVPLSDMAQAKKVAEQVLDAWKSGSAMEDMKNLSPPIIVSEDLWRKQLTLHSYTIQGEGAMLGPNARFEIQLSYSDKGGKKMDKTIAYLVTTTPAITFFREDN